MTHTPTAHRHSAVTTYVKDCQAGKLSRREFLTRATALGLATPLAYGLIGLDAPAVAQTPKIGGTLRIEMPVKASKEPQTFDWPELANVTRGCLEYLVQNERDGSFTPVLLEGWSVDETATEYTLQVRQGVTWQNGDPFTAQDVARNISNWADASVEGNSMGRRLGAIAKDGKVAQGAVTVVDEFTVKLTLSRPDVTLIASFADYPAAVTHASHQGDATVGTIGTGPYTITAYDIGVKAVLERAEGHTWWGGQAPLDRVEFIDYGREQVAVIAAAEADEIDMNFGSNGDFIQILDGLGWTKSEAVTANTITIRPNQKALVDGEALYADVRVRKAIQMAVDNAVVMELGHSGHGVVAQNHHVCPIHPEYAEVAGPKYDPEAALALLTEAGAADKEFEITSLNQGWVKDTADVVGAQLRKAGFTVKRTVIPGSSFWNSWKEYPFSATTWGHRPLAVQVYNLAYRSNGPWNETGFSNAEFDALLSEAVAIADADARSKVMAKLEQILIDEGVTIQPFWRSIFRHARPTVRNGDMHPTNEIRPQEMWLDA